MFKDAILIKEAISKERAKITYDYFLLKEKVALKLMEDGYVPKDAVEWGTLNDSQVENAFSMYGDILGDAHVETDILKPSNPYSVSSGCADKQSILSKFKNFNL